MTADNQILDRNEGGYHVNWVITCYWGKMGMETFFGRVVSDARSKNVSIFHRLIHEIRYFTQCLWKGIELGQMVSYLVS